MSTSKKELNRKARHARIRAKIDGTAEKPRLVIYRSLNNHYAQLVDDATHLTLISCDDLKLKLKGNKSERAKKVGMELAKLATEKKITTCVFDRNGFRYHGRVKAIAEGAREGGLKF